MGIIFKLTDDLTLVETTIAGWLMLDALPASAMILDDWLLPASQYLRTKITPTGLVVAETNVGGVGTVNHNPANLLAPNIWYWYNWLSYFEHATPCNRSLFMLWQNGVRILTSNLSINAGTTLNGVGCLYGFGENVSGGGYLNFSTTCKRTTHIIKDTNGNPFPPQLADYVDATAQAIFNCRQPVGSVASLTDTSGHGNNLTAGNLIINPNGPF